MKKVMIMCLIILISIFGIYQNISYASWISEIQGETRPRPTPPPSNPGNSGGSSNPGTGSGGSGGGGGTVTPDPTPDPTPEPEPEPDPDPDTDPGEPEEPEEPEDTGPIYQYVNKYEFIEGNAFEDIKNMASDIAQETGIPTTNGQKDADEKGIPKIRVELLSGENVVATQYTDSQGNYRFDGMADGDYRVRFYYGDLGGTVDGYSNEEVKEILKYNGQDYYATSVGGEGTVIDSYTKDIMIRGKGCIQLFLVIDNSASMIENKYNGKTRLEYQALAAKKLVDELLAESDNIYIGIVAFGEQNVVLQHLTNNKEVLDHKLNLMLESADELTSAFAGCTNIRGAMETAKENFVNKTEDSNRYIFLLSDGVPLTEGETIIYTEDLYDEAILQEKLSKIVDATKKEFENIINEGIKISTLITKTDEPEIEELVNTMCDVEGLNFFHVDDKDATNIITKEIKDDINSSEEENIKDFSNYHSYFLGADEEWRRNEVNAAFSKFDKETSKLFEVIDNYNGSEEDKNKAIELSNKSWMCATTGTYHIRTRRKWWRNSRRYKRRNRR